MRFRITILIGFLLTFAGMSRAAEETPLLAHSPTVSQTSVVFSYGGYLWSVPRDGGDARQLTTGGHEGLPVFSPDGKQVLFYSGREAYADFSRLYTVPVEGGPAQALPMWRGEAASFSPDGTRIAYVPNEIWQTAWKRYRGG